jgi:hypothetical protein
MKRLLPLLIAFLLILGNGLAARAQTNSADAPLLLLRNGDFVAWSPLKAGLEQRTNWGYNQAPIISPDGKWAAYKSYAQLAVDAIKRVGGVGGGDLPANIWLIDVITNDAMRIADQPADASFMAENNTPDKFVVRSFPVWSPDGTAVAWAELLYPEQSYQIGVYTLAEHTIRTFPLNFAPQYGVPSAPDLAWAGAGIVVRSTTIIQPDGNVDGVDTLMIFSPSGELVRSVEIGYLDTFFPITSDDGGNDLAVLTRGKAGQQLEQPVWMLLDGSTGDLTEMDGFPELYSLSAPEGANVTLSVEAEPNWTWNFPDAQNTLEGPGKLGWNYQYGIAISPDGKTIAFIKDGKASIYSGSGQIEPLEENITALAWGPVGWRVSSGN